MANVSYRLEDLKKAIVGIGYVGENDHMHVLIDCKEVFDEYPDAVATMAIVPPVGESYPKVVNRNGDVVEWLVKNSDVAAEGDGEFQITFTEGEVIKKSVNGRFRVIRSISGSGNAPSGYEDWETDANEKLAAVEEATQKAEDAAEHQPRINASGYWEIWDAETGAYVATSTKAQGDKGDPGDPGTPGDPTELLDDTAGEGDTNKTWSADKIDGEIADVKTAIQGVEDDTDTIKETLGLDGTVVDYGTDFPLEITADEGAVVNLTFDTAQSYYVANKNLFGQENVSFTNYEKVNLPFKLPAGTYTLSSLVTTTDTDRTYSVFIIFDGSSAIASYYLERDTRKSKTFTTQVPFNAILFYASDDQTHGQGDTATWSSVQLEANESATEYIEPDGYVESVSSSNSITITSSKTYIYTDDFSDVTGYGITGGNPVIPQMKSDIEKHDKFITDNNFEGNPGDKYNVLKVPYDVSDFTDNAMIASDGSLLTGSSYVAFMVSPLIEVSKIGLYGIKVSKENNNVGNLINSVNGFCFYGQDGTTAISRTAENLSNVSGNIYTLDIPEGTYYVRFTVYKVASDTQDRTVTQFNQWILLPDANSPIGDGFFMLSTPKRTGHTDRIVRSDGSFVRLCSTDLPSQKILVFGDSIWGNDRNDGVSDFLADYSGATIYNCAIGGTWIYGNRSTYSGAPAWKAFDGVNLIHAKITNTWTDQDTYVGDVTEYASTVLTLLKSIDMSKIDIVILSYGTNDFNNNISASDIADAYASAITEILTNYPKIRILICTPAWRMFESTDGDVYENNNNETTRDMVDAIVTMAESNHVEVLDMLSHLPWRALTKAYYLDNDEVHPNTQGNKVYAHVVNGKLKTMY